MFGELAEVKKKTTGTLPGITGDEFINCFEQRIERLDKCISASAEFFCLKIKQIKYNKSTPRVILCIFKFIL